jgi:TonB family protein
MSIVIAPIAATTSLSILLHGTVVAALLALHSQTNLNEAVGKSIEIELVSSFVIADQHETDMSRKQLLDRSQQEVAEEKVSDVASVDDYDKRETTKVVAALYSENRIEVMYQQQRISENDGNVAIVQSTAASQQRHSILELLHSSISNNKKYPYLAKRQGREGVTRVAFVLHPDGSIQNTRLINSSSTITLDQAALSAVKSIEPFVVAQDYLDTSEEFHVDVVFDLL